MTLQRVSAAIALADAATTPDEFIPVFHDWIRTGAVEGLLIDVARYGHVHHGPGVMLIGHQGDYAIDMGGGRPSLRYTLKRDAQGTAAELVALAVRRLIGACAQLPGTGTRVANGELVVTVADRLRALNEPDVRSWIVDVIATGTRDALGGAEIAVALADADRRDPITATVSFADGILSRAGVTV